MSIIVTASTGLFPEAVPHQTQTVDPSRCRNSMSTKPLRESEGEEEKVKEAAGLHAGFDTLPSEC